MLERRPSARRGRSSRFDNNWDGFCNRGWEHLVAAVGCAYKARLGVLRCVGATVIVHNCVHNEDQPWAGFTSRSSLSARFFFISGNPSCFWEQENGLRALLSCSQEQEVKTLHPREGHWPLLNSSLTAGQPYREVRQDVSEVHVSCPRPAQKQKTTAMATLEPRKTMPFWLNRLLVSSSDLMDVHHPSPGKMTWSIKARAELSLAA